MQRQEQTEFYLMCASIECRPALVCEPPKRQRNRKTADVSKKKRNLACGERKRARVKRRQPTDLPVKLVAEILKSFIIGDCVQYNRTTQTKTKTKPLDSMRMGVLIFFFREIYFSWNPSLRIVRETNFFFRRRRRRRHLITCRIYKTYALCKRKYTLSKCGYFILVIMAIGIQRMLAYSSINGGLFAIELKLSRTRFIAH